MDADSKWYSGVRRCDGSGLVFQTEPLKVKVPPGIATGQKLKLRGKGNMSRDTHNAGDLFVLIDVAEHPLFKRRGGGFDLRGAAAVYRSSSRHSTQHSNLDWALHHHDSRGNSVR